MKKLLSLELLHLFENHDLSFKADNIRNIKWRSHKKYLKVYSNRQTDMSIKVG